MIYFQPHRFCLLNNDALIVLMNAANAVIAFSYYLIPTAFLLIFIKKNGGLGDTTRRFIVGYGFFIILCGTTHLLDIVVIYLPAYWIQAAILALTAVVSLPVAIFTVRKLPFILGWDSDDQVETGEQPTP